MSRCVAGNYASTGGRDAPDHCPRSPKDRHAQQPLFSPTTSTLKPLLPTLDGSVFGSIDYDTAVKFVISIRSTVDFSHVIFISVLSPIG